MTKASGVDKAHVVQTWIIAGLKDFYVSFEFEQQNKWHAYSTFFCHQGLEKICKAYRFAHSASRWENLPEEQALQFVDRMARNLGHNLESLFESLKLPKQCQAKYSIRGGENVKKSAGYGDEDLVTILQKAYIEARYPVPVSNRIHRQYPISKTSKIYSAPVCETAPIEYARKIALIILQKIECDYSIKIPNDKSMVSNRIKDDDWKRFKRIFFGKNNPE